MFGFSRSGDSMRFVLVPLVGMSSQFCKKPLVELQQWPICAREKPRRLEWKEEDVFQRWSVQTRYAWFSNKYPYNLVYFIYIWLLLYAGAAANRGDSTSILFLDVKAAYYRVIRQLAVRGREQNSIERVMEHFDLGATDLQELLNEIHRLPEGSMSNFTNRQELMLEELLSSTWFSAQHRSQLFESLAGSRPGDALADVVFGIVFKRILHRVTARLQELLQIEDMVINGDVSLTATVEGDRQAPQLLQVSVARPALPETVKQWTFFVDFLW